MQIHLPGYDVIKEERKKTQIHLTQTGERKQYIQYHILVLNVGQDTATIEPDYGADQKTVLAGLRRNIQ